MSVPSVAMQQALEHTGMAAAALDNEKKLDLSFKEGQTIKINIGVSQQRPEYCTTC
jgi:hypothetical protein